MNRDLSNLRQVYKKDALLEANTPDNPMVLFDTWFEAAAQCPGISEVNAMNLATIGVDNFPKNRIVLLKSFSKDGFVFYTNYESEKGKAIRKNPAVCLSFFWDALERQVIVKGVASKVDSNVSDNYFKSRPVGSQLGAWASQQSHVVKSRQEIDQALEAVATKFGKNTIPRPKHWGGFNVKPISIEFWQGRPNRMHDRIRYTETNNHDWKKERLAP
ncbi:pyridoxamine 5'-phosphate oxidase [Flavobacteriaceae bacterium F08102]|nr:pyridoxamine 5'-phosphate oxidase [Flavobacteriaceae bacterium F08102]